MIKALRTVLCFLLIFTLGIGFSSCNKPQEIRNESVEESSSEETTSCEILSGETNAKVYISAPIYEGEEYIKRYTYIFHEEYNSYITEELTNLLEEHKNKDVWYTLFVDVFKDGTTEKTDEAFYSDALSYVESAGAENIRSASDASDITIDSDRCYYIDAQEETIRKMLEYGNFSIALARTRVGDYNNSITDHLTTLLENATDEDTFNVWVLTAADVYNYEMFEGETVTYQVSSYISNMQSAYYSMYFDSICTTFAQTNSNQNLTNIDKWPEKFSIERTLINERLSSIANLGYNADKSEQLYYNNLLLNPNRSYNETNEQKNFLSIAPENKDESYRLLNGISDYMDKYIKDITDKAGITAKINGNDYIDEAMSTANDNYMLPNGNPLPARRFGSYVVSLFPSIYETKNELHWAVIPGFEALSLTKSEILKLAEDDRIRAIYSTSADGSNLTVSHQSGYTPWV